MERFTQITGRLAAMPGANIDTDVIMPKVFLKGIDRAGLDRGVFHDLRFDGSGKPRADFVLNRSDMANTRFLVVGPNFGCGSSREHAVWGLLQYGIRAIIGTTFAGIFADNAANNGLLLITLPGDDVARIMDAVQKPTDATVNLEEQHISIAGSSVPFTIEPARRRSLMLGLDQIGETLNHADRIREFQADYLGRNTWLSEERGA